MSPSRTPAASATPEVVSRFRDGQAFLAAWYRVLWPQALPFDVDRMRPRQIASVLGLDLEDAVRAIPVDQRAPRRPRKNRAARRAQVRGG